MFFDFKANILHIYVLYTYKPNSTARFEKKTAELYFNFNGGNGIVRSTGVRSTGVNI